MSIHVTIKLLLTFATWKAFSSIIWITDRATAGTQAHAVYLFNTIMAENSTRLFIIVDQHVVHIFGFDTLFFF